MNWDYFTDGFPEESEMQRKSELAVSGPVDQLEPDIAVDLKVYAYRAIRWGEEGTRYGRNWRSVFPAMQNGQRCWLVEDAWEPNFGYSCYKKDENIIGYEGGIALIRAAELILKLIRAAELMLKLQVQVGS